MSRSASSSVFRSRSGRSAKRACHGPRRLQVPLGVLAQEPARRVASVFFSRMQVSTSRSGRPLRLGVADAVRGHGPQAEGRGQVEQALVRGFLLAPPVALHIDEDALRPEGGHEARQPIGVGRPAEGLQARQGHEPGQPRPLPASLALAASSQPQPAFALRHPRLHPGDQPAQGLVAPAVLHQQRAAPLRPRGSAPLPRGAGGPRPAPP